MPDIFGNGREQMRQQSDADKDELQADRPTESGVGLSQKKSWPHRLTTSAHGSIPLIHTSAFNSSANCWECRAQSTTTSPCRRARESASAPPARPVVLEAPVLRQPQ